MPNLALNTIALVSTLNPAPLNGSPSSTDYNDFQNQTLLDLTAITAFLDNVLIPMLVALDSSAISGLDGTSIYGDSTDQTSLFYDQVTGQSLTLSDSLRQLQALIASNNLAVSSIKSQVGQLQQKLSSTNQNNIAITLQNLTNSLNVLTNQQTGTNTAVSEVQNIVSKQQSKRVSLTATEGTANYSLTWPTAFADNNYTVVLSLQDPNNSCTLLNFNYSVTPGLGITVNIANPTTNSLNVVLHATATHD